MKKLVMLITLGLVVPMFGARPVLKYGDINPITGKVVERYKGKVAENLPPKPVRVNKGKLVKIAEEEGLFTPEERELFMQEEEQEMLPERRPAYVGFVGEEGQPLPPALPPRPTVKPGKQFTAEDLQNVKLKKRGQQAVANMAEAERASLPPALPPKPATKPSKQFAAKDLENVKLKKRGQRAVGSKETLMVEKQTGQKEMVKRPFTGADLKKQKGLLKKPSDVRPAATQEGGLRESLNAEITKRRGSISGSEQEEVTEKWED